MDNSSVMIDSCNFKQVMGDMIDSSLSVIEKRTGNVYEELNKMREEYSILMNKFIEVTYCKNKDQSVVDGDDSILIKDNTSVTEGPHQNQDNTIDKSLSSIQSNKTNSNNNFRCQVKNTQGKKQFKLEKFQANNPRTICTGNFTPIKNSNKSQFNGSIPKLNAIRSKSPNVKGSQKPGSLLEGKAAKNFPRLTNLQSNYGKNFYRNHPLVQMEKQNRSNNELRPEVSIKREHSPISNKNELLNLINDNNNYTNKFIHKKNSLEQKTKNKSSPKTREKPTKGHRNMKEIILKEKAKINTIKGMRASSKSPAVDNANRSNLKESSNKINEGTVEDKEDVNPGNNAMQENRKFSILDIEAMNEAVENTQSKKQPVKNDQTLEGKENFDNSSCSSKNSHDSPARQKEILDKLANNTEKMCYLLAKSDVVPFKLRIKFSSINKVIFKEYPKRELIADYQKVLQTKADKIEKSFKQYVKDPESEQLVNQKFKPSKTAQLGLNFITKENELNMLQQNFGDNKDVHDILKIIYILVRQSYESLDANGMVSNLFNNILNKYKLDNLKSLFLNVICHNLVLSSEQLKAFNKIVDNNEKITNSSYMQKNNPVLANLVFILKEIHEYLNLKTLDGIPVVTLKKVKKDWQKLNDKVCKLDTVISGL